MYGFDNNSLSNMFNEIYVFMLHSIRHILKSPDVDRVTWYTKNSAYVSGENDPESFISLLVAAGVILLEKNRRCIGNFVLTGKQGFDILKKIGYPRFKFEGNYGVIDAGIIVRYIPSMEENRFVMSVYESDINLWKDNLQIFYYKTEEEINAMVVGEIVDGERPK